MALALIGCCDPVQANVLGADCCANLEERIAELEATAVRKGNRKVSLTLSGYVGQQMTAWDDGADSNVYMWGLGPTQGTNFRLSGQAKVSSEWTAGYLLRVQNLSDNPFGANQFQPNTNGGLNVQMSYWWLGNPRYGTINFGQQAQAAKSAAMFTDLSGSQIMANYVLFDGAGFFLRNDGKLTNVIWGNLGFCYSIARPWGGDCNGVVQTAVRYDSPVFGGFSVSASWGEHDSREIAARFKRDMGAFRIAAAIGASRNTDESVFVRISADKRSDYYQAGGYLEHLPSGLFLHGAYGYEDNNDTLLLNGGVARDGEHYYVKAGLRRRFSPLGHTIFFGEYAEYLDQLGPAALAVGATSSEFTRWGGGLVQEFDSAALSLWVKYRHHEGEVSGSPLLTDIDDADFVGFGGLINF